MTFDIVYNLIIHITSKSEISILKKKTHTTAGISQSADNCMKPHKTDNWIEFAEAK